MSTSVAVVMGSERGIGQDIATRLVADGHRVIVADLPTVQDGIAESVATIEQAGGKATGAEVDLTDEESLSILVTTAAETGGKRNVCIANGRDAD